MLENELLFLLLAGSFRISLSEYSVVGSHFGSAPFSSRILGISFCLVYCLLSDHKGHEGMKKKREDELRERFHVSGDKSFNTSDSKLPRPPSTSEMIR